MSTSFSDDLKHMVRDTANTARERLTAMQGGLQPVVAKLRALPKATKQKIAVAGVAIAVLGIGLAMRGGSSAATENPRVRSSEVLSIPAAEAPRAPSRSAKSSYAVGKAEERQGEYKAAAESYAIAARKGDARGLNKLVAMTHAPKCEARSEAADALASIRSKKAVAALKKLARSRFKDESRTPGIFSCSSRRAAQKALERHRG
jgi:hypothetical protein